MSMYQPHKYQLAKATGSIFRCANVTTLEALKAILIATVLGAIIIVALCSCTKKAPPRPDSKPISVPTYATDGVHDYRMIRPMTKVGPNLWEIELWERIGDTNHVYRMVWPAHTNEDGTVEPAKFAGMAR